MLLWTCAEHQQPGTRYGQSYTRYTQEDCKFLGIEKDSETEYSNTVSQLFVLQRYILRKIKKLLKIINGIEQVIGPLPYFLSPLIATLLSACK